MFYPSKHLQKLHLKMSPAEVVRCIYLVILLTNVHYVSIDAHSVDPDKITLKGAV